MLCDYFRNSIINIAIMTGTPIISPNPKMIPNIISLGFVLFLASISSGVLYLSFKAIRTIIPDKKKQAQEKDEYYTVRYNTTKIFQGSPAESLLKVYVTELMPLWIVGEGRIKLIPSAETGQNLLSVECYKDQGRDQKIGEGRVDIGEDIGDKALRIIGMMNMALVASRIPSNVSSDELKTTYDPLVSFIARQYKEISGIDLPESVWQDISKGICIILPHAAPVSLEALEYYRLAIAQLKQAA